MINSYQSLYTITNGLILQQLQQEINASNISNPSQDANGYLINSLQRVNPGQGAPLIFGGANGNLAVGTGPTLQSITRLRDSFLDAQIQNESSVLGFAEVLANTSASGILDRINAIVNGTSTLDGSLSSFAAAWGNLAADPLNAALQNSVVQAGKNFAQTANSEYAQLQDLLNSNGAQIQSTVAKINGILGQLNSINKQLLNSQGANVNGLLDVRDYALDLLSRLINIQVNFGTAGTVDVFLANSSLTLLDNSGRALFQTNVSNQNYPGMVGVTIQSPQGGFYGGSNSSGGPVPNDLSRLITGGNLGGELQAQMIIHDYQSKVDQIAFSTLSVTNSIHEAGYAGDGVTTGTAFFSGLSAQDIALNPALLANGNLVAASLFPNFDPNYAAANPATPGITYQGTIAEYLSNLPNLLSNNFMESNSPVALAYFDPTVTLNTPGLQKTPTSGNFSVNGVSVTYNAATDTIDTILAKITQADPSVYAVYNAQTSQFFLYSQKPITVSPGTSNFVSGINNWSFLANYLTSSIRMNSSLNPLFSQIDYYEFTLPVPDPSSLNSTLPSTTQFNTGPNSISFKIVPSANGTFSLYPPLPTGNQFNWDNTMSLGAIGNMISAFYGAANVTFSWDSNTQTLSLINYLPNPMNIVDVTGNFTQFTGLNSSQPLGSLSSGLLGRVDSDLLTAKATESQAANSLQQLNTAQANIAGVSTSGSTPGVPIANIQQQAMQDLITYNAMLQVLQVIDQMYADLVTMTGSNNTGNFFQNRA
ncbi:MAG TPA: hypothetical protein VHE12_14210 [bacterium]|nr:hypothetical protein [bacterium]